MLNNLKKFEIFLSVAELGSITATAKYLGMSKAAVSQDIKNMEVSWNIPLFKRTTRKIELTPEGELLFSRCKTLKQELNKTENLILGLHKKPLGKLTVSCNPAFVEPLALNTINTYLTLFPDTEVELITAQKTFDLDNAGIDIAIGMTWQSSLNVVAKSIGKTRYVLCASPGYLSKHGLPTSLHHLIKDHNIILHSGRSQEEGLQSLVQPMKLNVKSRLTVDNIESLYHLALNDYGIVQLHEYVISKALQTGRLIEILPQYFKPEIDLMVYYQKHRYVQPKIKKFIEILLAGIKR
jgi:DNA-binding transcriptional LysR family regulator